jgi:hypothetical protein
MIQFTTVGLQREANNQKKCCQKSNGQSKITPARN